MRQCPTSFILDGICYYFSWLYNIAADRTPDYILAFFFFCSCLDNDQILGQQSLVFDIVISPLIKPTKL